MQPEDLEDQLELHDSKVMRHGVADAEAALRQRRPADADIIISTYRERIGALLNVPSGLIDPDLEGWYQTRPDHDSPRWTFARDRLRLPTEVVTRTSDVTDQIVARLGNPRHGPINTRGLVLGHVQSGKTTSYLSVAAKAADAGYDLIIILAGVHNSLRRQTQDRAARILVHNNSLWWLGTAVGDFRSDGNGLSSHLAGHGKRGLLVVKKHATILQRLAEWLEEESDVALLRLAVLVIDDEADQAGLDVSSGGELEGVHKQLSRIVNLQTSDGNRRCAYLAYTATPYANVLTSQADFGLYPRDFIYPLDKPPGHVGAQELFGDACIGHPVQLEQDNSEDVLTDGLRDAIRWFVLATAARAALGASVDSFHSSMLIHTTASTEDQIALRPRVEEYLGQLRAEFERDQSDMEVAYEHGLSQVPSRPGGGDEILDEATAAWSAVRQHIDEVFERLIDRTPAGEPFVEDGRAQRAHSGVVVDNSKVDWKDRLTYSDLDAGQPSVTVIAIGGNTLSRGLTLEGLVCSYFARTARNYDSLMQMGRWFGYRPGYRHLLRVWTTQELLDWFVELNKVEKDFRQELLWMQEKRLTPDEYGPRIRVSPNMNITRAAAMRSVSKHISYSDTVLDPAWLDLEPEVLEHNQDIARSLASDLGRSSRSLGSSMLFEEVPLERVEQFVFAFGFHAQERRIDLPSLRRYIDEERAGLERWNVIFKSINRTNAAQFDYGGAVGRVGTVSRARVRNMSMAYIQSLVDSDDHRLDVGGGPPSGDAERRAADEPPLLVVYAIDPVSTPLRKGNRATLDAPTTPISISLAFPRSPSAVAYVAPVVASIEGSPDLGDHHDG